MLSNNDLRKQFEKQNISIFPFIRRNIESANICITASKFAWTIEGKKEQDGEKEYLFTQKNGKDQICIPGKKSALIFAQESVFLGEKLAGVCLPRVDLSLRGLAYNGSPMKPGRAELLKVIMHNQTESEIFIDVGERIAVLMFFELSSKGITEKQEDDHNILLDDFLKKCENPNSIIDVLNVSRKEYCKEKFIKEKMIDEPDYIEYKNSKDTIYMIIKQNPALSIFCFLLIFQLILMLILILIKRDLQQSYLIFLGTTITLTGAIFAVFLTVFLYRKSR